METKSAYLFVYGTLLLTTNQFGQYLNAHCKLIASAKFKGRLYDIGEYPGAVVDESAGTYVYGSIFLIDDTETVLQILDDYEGISPNDPLPHEYTRKLFMVETNQGPVNCWVYFYALSVDQYRPIISGNYIEYIANQSV